MQNIESGDYSGSIGSPLLVFISGFTYFSLALLDLLAHVIPAAVRSLTVFKPLDIVTGAGSSIPLLMYTLFLFVFTTSEFIPTLPEHLQELTKYALLFFIPLIFAANELGSFVNISYRIFGQTLTVGFTDEGVHTGFDVLTLALLTVFQLLILAVAIYRLTNAFAYRREVHEAAATDGGEIKAHLFNGLGWIVGGVMLGVIETVIGFAGGGFALAFTRRALRMLGRAGLVLGAANGVDTVEDFRIFKFEAAQQQRRSKLLGLISNPRNSTFKHVGGYQFDPEAALPRALQNRMSALSDVMGEIMTVSIRYSSTGPADSSGRATENAGSLAYSNSASASATSAPRPPPFKRPGTPPLLSLNSSQSYIRRPQRVTVHYVQGRAPVLELRRFSDLLDSRAILTLTHVDAFSNPSSLRTKSLPSHIALGWSTASLPQFSVPNPSQSFKAVVQPATHSDTPPPSAADSNISIPASAIISPVMRADRAYARRTFAGRDLATVDLLAAQQPSSPSTSLEGLHALTMQFPTTPVTQNWLVPQQQQQQQQQQVPTVSRLSSVSDRAAKDSSGEHTPLPERRVVSLPPKSKRSTYGSRVEVILGDDADQNAMDDARPRDRTTSESTDMAQYSEEDTRAAAAAALPTPVSMMMPITLPSKAVMQPETSQPARKSRSRSVASEKVLRDMDSTPPSGVADSTYADVDSMESRTERIKSFGSAPKRRTPTPTSSASLRDSIVAEVSDVPVDKSQRRVSKKLKKRSSRKEVETQSVITVARSDRSVFED